MYSWALWLRLRTPGLGGFPKDLLLPFYISPQFIYMLEQGFCGGYFWLIPTDLYSGLRKTNVGEFVNPWSNWAPISCLVYTLFGSSHQIANMGWLTGASRRQKKASFRFRTIQSFFLGRQEAWKNVRILYYGMDDLHPFLASLKYCTSQKSQVLGFRTGSKGVFHGKLQEQDILPPSISQCVWKFLTWPRLVLQIITELWWVANLLIDLVDSHQHEHQGSMLWISVGTISIVLSSWWLSPPVRSTPQIEKKWTKYL